MADARKLYLVDAMSNIHRAYHAIQRLSTSAGKPTNAIYGFINMLRKMLREHTPDYLAVAWDGPERTLRKDTYSEYKANRVPMASDLASQIGDIRRALDAYRIPILELAGYEADDVLGTLSAKAAAQGFDVVIVTADKDMLQLVRPGIRVFHTGRAKFLDEAGVREFFGVPPGQVAGVVALMGDSVANVPGGPGVGQATARGRVLLAVADRDGVAIAEDSPEGILQRWKELDRPGRQIWLADAKPVDTLLARAGRAVAGEVFDVCLVQYVLSPGVGGSEFETMAFQRLGQKVTSDKEAGVVACALPEGYAIETADRWLAERAATTREIAKILAPELSARPALEKIYREIERPLTPGLARMEIEGVAIDVPLLKEMSARMETDLRALESKIWAEAGEEFNINSPVKLGQILFEKLGYPSSKKTAKTRTSSTGVEVLSDLAEKGYPVP